MNIYQGIFIFIMLIIIPLSTSHTFERLRRDPEQYEVCGNNINCESYEECINGECQNSCRNLNCRSNEGCFVRNHTASCQCSPGFAYDSDHTCAKICFVDSDCGEHETCQDDGYTRKCKCRAGFAIDTHANGVCRWRCSRNRDCAPGSKCKYERCIDYCDRDECSRNEICKIVFVSKKKQCVCSRLEDANWEGRCP